MSRTSRLLAIALAISVLLNVFALGFLIGRTRLAPPPPLRPGEAIRLDLRAIGEALPKSERRELRRALSERRDELRRRLADLRRAQREVDAALAADPFDPGRLEAAYARLREASAAILEPVQRTMVIFAEKLDSEQRRTLAEHLARMRHRWHEDGEGARGAMLRRLDALKARARELAQRRRELDARLKTASDADADVEIRSLRAALDAIEREEARLMARIARMERRLARNRRRTEVETGAREDTDEDEHEREDDDDRH